MLQRPLGIFPYRLMSASIDGMVSEKRERVPGMKTMSGRWKTA
jgi:hypothetical protein